MVSPFFLAEGIDPSAITTGGVITTGVLMAVCARLYSELRGESKQSREDKIVAINAINNAANIVERLSGVVDRQFGDIKHELDDLRKAVERHHDSKSA